MSNWKLTKLNDIGKIVTGKTPETIDQLNYGSDYMFIGPTDLHKHFIISKSEKMISEKGLLSIKGSIIDGFSILVGCIGWDMGNVAIVNSKCATNQQINSITQIKNSYNPFYIYYWLKQKKQYFYQIASVTRTPMLKKSDFSNIELNIPNKNQQDKVAKILKDIDSKIELNNRINAELEAMAKTLYDYWFVQFDFPNEEGKPYKTSGGAMVWNEELKREVPEGWEVGKFGDYCMSQGGFAFKSNWWTNEGVAVVKIKDIQEDYTINLSDLARVNMSDKNVDDKFKAKAGDILIAMTGATIGKYAIVPIADFSIYVNQRVGYFNLGNNPTKRLPFLINSLNQSYFRESIFTLANGAAQPNISNEQINNIPLLIPVQTLIKLYNESFQSYYQCILNNQSENQKLSSLRDWLLPMLMNGQVKVGE